MLRMVSTVLCMAYGAYGAHGGAYAAYGQQGAAYTAYSDYGGVYAAYGGVYLRMMITVVYVKKMSCPSLFELMIVVYEGFERWSHLASHSLS